MTGFRDWFLSLLNDVFQDAAGEFLGLLVTLAFLLALFLLVALPLTWFLKRSGLLHVEINAAKKPSRPQPVLDAVDRGVSRFYEYSLWALLAAVTLFAALFFYGLRTDVNRGFLYFYFSIAYLFFLGWSSGQLYAVRRRRRSLAVPTPVSRCHDAATARRLTNRQLVAAFVALCATFTALFLFLLPRLH
jgi:hypothetical protein